MSKETCGYVTGTDLRRRIPVYQYNIESQKSPRFLSKETCGHVKRALIGAAAAFPCINTILKVKRALELCQKRPVIISKKH